MSSSCASADVKATRLVAGALALLLAACEAPLDLEAVQRQMAEPVRRSDLYQAAASGDGTVVVVGNQGVVLTSQDQAASWQRTELPGWPALIGVAHCPGGAFAALAADGQVWVSENGVSGNQGASWSPTVLESEEAVQGIACDAANRLWVVGSFSSIFSSTDLGRNWSLFTLDEDIILTNVQFLDRDNGYVTGEFGTVLKTTDGGANWERLPDLPAEFYPQAMHFSDVLHGRVVGLQGQVLLTTDGGRGWNAEATTTRAPLYGIAATDGALYAVGGEGNIQELRNGHWRAVDHGKPIRLFLRLVHGLEDGRLLVGGQAGALYVIDPAGSAAGSADRGAAVAGR
ncbi:WD40/YVTN/BNR-like repeat-containing protein [Elongatibacter sediminis]|uniref:YCF48-related protein n=1 Tax=Elongatibacter sediminis TaxID=3119006 RepID=A0AAW9R9P3_9GAMM